MRRVVVILLLGCLTFHSLMKVGIAAWYEINKEYVSTVLCINKNKPELKCNGKCYLTKQLKKADTPQSDTEKNLPGNSKKSEHVEYLLSGNLKYSIMNIAVLSSSHYTHYVSPVGYSPINEIFHPPSC